ncbi:hypothetical protein RHSIM_Rhsim11G0179800 [Rhododendron simsii]|uniref:rhamnogalacturonan endolyase n=1 Tax=Rhododendron simsii TaxID=118357 RepID=A0A834G645_RHOSS|nr:hypothetical protein RHSIM_Rhsim11G0179800 [Rhododendron simsii]
MAVADDRRRFMPLPDDRDLKRCQPLVYKETVLLVNALELEFTTTSNTSLISYAADLLNTDQNSFLELIPNSTEVVIDNGILQVTLSNPEGMVTGISYKGIDNLLEVKNDETKRGFIVLRGSSGFYWFHYMAVADNRRRFMPLPDDRDFPKGQPLPVKEAVLLVDPIEPEFKGQVDDKYQYSCDNKDLCVHGWISMKSPDSPPVGFWQITPSDEFRTGGPLKQNLSSHVGPTCLAEFVSPHYAGEDLELKIGQGEAWKKVFGPVFVHLNSVEGGKSGDEALTLWEGAKRQMMAEVQSWPYTFPESDDFPSSDQRGNVSGRLVVRDRYINKDYISANGAYVGLAPPGDVGSWQRECKGYQFWTRTDEHGYFSINHIRAGDYNLYAWVPGFIGDYRKDNVVTITPGCHIPLGNLVYEPPRDGPTLWEIGIPDRSAAEFYVPDPDPKYINPLFVNHPDRFRQYGLWERYAELYPNEDLVYTVGVSDYRKDWFFAQQRQTRSNLHLSYCLRSKIGIGIGICIRRRKNDNTYQGTTWQIKFKLDMVDQTGTYKLRVALAAANLGELQVRVNDPNTTRPLFSSGLIGRDNAVARHGIHGLYWLFNVEIPNAVLVKGEYNTIYLTQPRGQSSLQNLMYDYIRLEGPPTKGHHMSYL